jgi:hypothetical protein
LAGNVGCASIATEYSVFEATNYLKAFFAAKDLVFLGCVTTVSALSEFHTVNLKLFEISFLFICVTDAVLR